MIDHRSPHAREGSEDERAYGTHWVSPQLSAKKRKRVRERQSKPPDLVVISPHNTFTCMH